MPGPKYFAVNVIQFVLIVCPILRKMQARLQNLPNVLVPKLPRYFVNFTINFLQGGFRYHIRTTQNMRNNSPIKTILFTHSTFISLYSLLTLCE